MMWAIFVLLTYFNYWNRKLWYSIKGWPSNRGWSCILIITVCWLSCNEFSLFFNWWHQIKPSNGMNTKRKAKAMILSHIFHSVPSTHISIHLFTSLWFIFSLGFCVLSLYTCVYYCICRQFKKQINALISFLIESFFRAITSDETSTTIKS